MPKTLPQIKEDWKKIQKDLMAIDAEGKKDVSSIRKSVRERVLRGDEINKNDTLGLLLKKEYELETELDRITITAELITHGKDIDDPTFKYELDLRMTKNDLALFNKEQIDNYRNNVRQRVILGEQIPTADVSGKLLEREYQNERELMRDSLEESYIKQGYDPSSKLFKMQVELDLIRTDMLELDEATLNQYRTEFNNKKNNGEVLDTSNGYMKLIQREFQLTSDMEASKQIAEEKKIQEQLIQQEMNLKSAEATAEATSKLVDDIMHVDEKPAEPRRGFWSRLFNRKPKVEPVVEETKKEEVKTETVSESEKKEPDKETSTEEKKKETEKTADSKATKKPEEKKLTEAERRLQEKKKKEQHRYRVEFAGKELKEEYRNCSDPKILADYLDKATGLSKDVREHLQNRALANAKIQSYEESRTIRQKVRPLCVKYKDGTLLLKNKKRDVPKQTSINGCWSAVLSDMLGHFGVDLSQEEIRAYRPDISKNQANTEAARNLMNRLNTDSMNEINDMADLIQRTVPNVAHHHMSLSPEREENKAVLKERVVDALLNKNSPVALLYGNHYLSVVGIKDNTLIVQNPSPKYNTKYQKLSIDDLFTKCAETGQVTMDWLEDLKFNKDGTCKNSTDQWKKMGIECSKREFKAGDNPNYMTHLRGNEYYDSSRIEQGIEETIYLPKMSFGYEKELAEIEMKRQQLQNVKDNILTLDEMKKENEMKDQLEFENHKDTL